MPFFWEKTEYSDHVWCDQNVLMNVIFNYYIFLRCVIYNKKVPLILRIVLNQCLIWKRKNYARNEWPPLPPRLVVACEGADAFGQLNSNVQSHGNSFPWKNISVCPYTTTKLGWIIIEVVLILKTAQLSINSFCLMGPWGSLACPQEKTEWGQGSHNFHSF